jgi:uncharacterized protein (TIGR02270 family)
MEKQATVIPYIVEQHAEEAAFLWLLRHAAVHEPHYSLKDLAELDERVEAHIDGLRVAGDYGWEVCKNNLELGEPGEVFIAGVLALEADDSRRLTAVYDVVQQIPETASALISAFGWVDPKQLQGKVNGLLISQVPLWRRIGVAACAIHRVDAGDHLKRLLIDEDADVCARAAKAVGELGREDLKPLLLKSLAVEHGAAQLWSAWAAVLVGDKGSALNCLRNYGLKQNSYRPLAMQALLRRTDLGSAKEILGALARSEETLRYAIQGVGISGDPSYIPWLIKQMDNTEVARVAGESFESITGVDLAYDDLEGDWPEGFEAGPSEDPVDPNVWLDEDEDLAWPRVKLVSRWWSDNKSRFQPGCRYLLGEPLSQLQCQKILISGKQRQRQAAAFELALMRPRNTLFETRGKGKDQLAVLAT